MSALGHKQTYAAQHGMSALLPIATAKAVIGTAGQALDVLNKPKFSSYEICDSRITQPFNRQF
jgi:hypothetical protein